MLYRIIFSILISTSLLSPALGMSEFDNENYQGQSVSKNVNEDSKKILSEQDKAFIQSLRVDKEKEENLPTKIAQLESLKKNLAEQQTALKFEEDQWQADEEELKRLQLLLSQDSAAQHNGKGYLKRKQYLEGAQSARKKPIEKFRENIVEFQVEVNKLDEEIARIQLKIVGEIRSQTPLETTGNLWDLYSGNAYQAKIKQLGQIANTLPHDVLSSIFSMTKVLFDHPFRVGSPKWIFPPIWKMRLVSKHWKEAADKFIIAHKLSSQNLALTPEALDENMKAISSVVKLFSLSTIYLAHWDPSNFENFSKLLSHEAFSKITRLNYIQSGESGFISDAMLEETGAFHLAKCFKYLPNLETLDIDSFLFEEGGKLIATSLYHLAKLKRLEMNNTMMGPLAVQELAKNLPCVTKLEELNIPGSHPGDIGAVELAKAMHKLLSLKTLDVSHVYMAGPWADSKKINSLGLFQLAEACSKHPSIIFLGLKGHSYIGLNGLNDLKNSRGENIEILK